MGTPKRILLPDTLELELLDVRKRLHALETGMGRPMSQVDPNSAVFNQTVPPVGNFDGVTKYDVTMSVPCTFKLQAPTAIILFSFCTALATAPGGGTFVYVTAAVSLSPWNPANWILESNSQVLDRRLGGYVNSLAIVLIGQSPFAGSVGPGAVALGVTAASPILPAGSYEVRQRLIGDNGTQLAYYQGAVMSFTPGG